jgi:hypothetical protein
VFIVRTKEGDKVLLVLGQKTGVFIVRTKEGNKVLLVLGQKTGVFIVRTKEGDKVFRSSDPRPLKLCSPL